MNIIKRYLEYRKNGKAVRHHEYVLPEPLFIGSTTLEDIARTHSPQLSDRKIRGGETTHSIGHISGDTLTQEDYRGEDAEAIKMYKRFKQ